MFVLVSYDVADDRRRNRIARAMKSLGDRVQFSVFEMNLEAEEFERMLRRLEKLVDAGEDSARIYKLCANCKTNVTIIGRGTVSEDPDLVII